MGRKKCAGALTATSSLGLNIVSRCSTPSLSRRIAGRYSHPPKQNVESETNGVNNAASTSPTSFSMTEDCCHRMGESVHKWSTLKGGRSRPGKENYVYMIWRYVDCCVPFETTRG